MKTLLVSAVVFAIGLVIGQQFLGGDSSTGGTTADAGEPKPLYWVAPMDKNYRRDGPGQSPMGMDLVPVYEADVAGNDDNSVTISPVVENNLGVKVAPVTRERLVLPVDTVGTVQFNEGSITHVHSRVEGWIERLGVAASGDLVAKGQTLFELYSPALVSAQEEYLAALRSTNSSLIRASRARLTALGLTAPQVEALTRRGKVEETVSVVADREGIVIDLNVRQGMFIKPATEVLSFGSLKSVWVLGEVFERQAHLVAPGQPVEARLTAMPGRSWLGTVDYIYPELDPTMRTLTVRINLTNQDQALKPNMLMDLSVRAEASEESLTIPRHALIKAGNHSRVVKSLGDGRYQSVLVKAGLEGEVRSETDGLPSTQSRVQIFEGLQEGDRVVTSAQFLIDSESNVDADLLRMEAPDSATTNDEPITRVITSGRVDKVMAQMGMVSITHDPIPEWEWPTMKMDFQVADSVPLDGFLEGETVQFELEKTGDWDYLVTGVGADLQDKPMEHGTTGADENSQSMPAGAVMARGEIKMLMLDMNMVEVVHQPIPEWDWPAMRMTFVVPEGEKLPGLSEGDEVNFALRELDSGDYEMSNVTVKTP